MTTENVSPLRVERLESAIDKLHEEVASLSTGIALLKQSLDTVTKAQEKRSQTVERLYMVAGGVVISAIVTWVIRGGLV